MIRSIDIEDEARVVLSAYYTAYCDPLPASYSPPFIRVTSAGGSERNTIDTFTVVIEGYAETDAEACEITRNAVGILRESEWYVRENTKAARFDDPLRPDLSRYRTTVLITAHQEEFEL
jgi:hypothetical protein